MPTRPSNTFVSHLEKVAAGNGIKPPLAPKPAFDSASLKARQLQALKHEKANVQNNFLAMAAGSTTAVSVSTAGTVGDAVKESEKGAALALDKGATELLEAACLGNQLCVPKLILGEEGIGSTETVPVADDLTGGKLENPLPIKDNKTVLISLDQRGEQGVRHTGNVDDSPFTVYSTTVTPIPDVPNWDDLVYQSRSSRPINMPPEGAGKSGAFNEAKRRSGIPVSKNPDRVLPNVDKRGNPQPGKIYEFDISKSGGGVQTIQIRDDAHGHFFGIQDTQNRGPHFNDQVGNHYDY